MNRLLFSIQNAFKHIIYHKYTSFVLLMALVFGFLFPLVALNDVNSLLEDGSVSKYVDASHVAIIEYAMKYKEEDEIYDVIKQGREKGLFDEAGFCVSQGHIIYTEKESYSGGVSGVSEEYLLLNSGELLEGAFFSGDDYAGKGERVCVLEHQSTLARNGIRVGDTIEILGDAYRIKGIIRAPRTYGGVLIPYAMSAELFSGTNSLSQYQIITYGVAEPKPASLAYHLFQDEGVISAQTGVQQEEIYYASIREVNGYRMLRAGIIIVFAVININLLFIGMIARERYSMAVRIAMGASLEIIKFEILMRDLMLVLLAFCISIFIYPGVSFLVKGSSHYLHDATIWQAGIGGVVLISITNQIIFLISFKKKEII